MFRNFRPPSVRLFLLDSIYRTKTCGLVIQTVSEAESSFPSRLLNAALAGDWGVAKIILQRDRNLLRDRLTPSGETALHIAAIAGEAKHEYFVKKLVEVMDEDDLTVANQAGSTALHFAALSGNWKIAYHLVKRNGKLPAISNHQQARPLLLAAMSGNGRRMVEFLLPFSNFQSWDDVEKSHIVNTCIDSGLYDVARQIVESYPMLAVAKDQNGEAPLNVLARKPSAFPSTSQPRWWTRTVYPLSCTKVVEDDDAFDLLERIWLQVPGVDRKNLHLPGDIVGPAFAAAELGNYEFLVKLLRERPEFIYIVNESSQSIYHIAVKHRHENIFSLIYEIGKIKDLVASYRDGEDNTMLHLAAKLAPLSQLNIIPGAALQMHRELLWYKEVEKIVPSTYRNMKNRSGKTPHELFIEEHNSLMKKGEKWMKGTSHSCMIVAALITTMVFITAFTVPGGNNNRGEPVLMHERLFKVFAIAKIIAMLSSSTSMVLFLCIRTSRYTEKDFLESLPYCLISGIVTLFVSLAGIMVAFCTSFLLYDRRGSAGAPTLLGVFFCVPVMFVFLMYQCLADITGSLYDTRHLFRSRHRLMTK